MTYVAASYIFIGSAVLIVASWTGIDKLIFSSAKEIFTMVLPIATGIVTYWFASRQPKQDSSGPASNDDESAKPQTAQGGTSS